MSTAVPGMITPEFCSLTSGVSAPAVCHAGRSFSQCNICLRGRGEWPSRRHMLHEASCPSLSAHMPCLQCCTLLLCSLVLEAAV